MSTFIRVKRHLQEDPLEEIVLNVQKKQKTDKDDKCSAVFKLASTIKNLDEV